MAGSGREALEEPRLWTVAVDSALSDPRSTGGPLRVAAPRSPALADIQSLVGTLLREPEQVQASRSGWLGWLAGLFSSGPEG